VPSPHGIFVVGCNAKINADELFLTSAVVTKIPALAPLSEAGYLLATRDSWKAAVDDDVRTPLYHWAGGLPRLLRLAHLPLDGTVSLACGGLCAFQRCFAQYKQSVQSLYSTSEDWFVHAYACMLASSTKARVSGTIAVDPRWSTQPGHIVARTYDDAAIRSIGAYNEATRRFIVPPITLIDQDATRMMLECPILPSELHPFLADDVVQHFGKHSALERGRLFEKPFMYAVYARYLLVHLKNTTQQWVPLERVFEDALNPDQIALVSKYEVNLSGGVVTLDEGQAYGDAVGNALTYLGGTAHHDAYLWCRGKSGSGPEFAAPVQLRHGQAKPESKLALQLYQTAPSGKSKEPQKVQFLLSVNQEARKTLPNHQTIVMVNADAMSSISWLWLISPQKPEKHRT
jgi:hypothetical protein